MLYIGALGGEPDAGIGRITQGVPTEVICSVPRLEVKKVKDVLWARIDDEPVTIGRAADNIIRLRDSHVSRTHCVIETVDGVICVRDLGSRYGTYVNGRRIDQVSLHHGDRIGVGPFELIYRDSNAQSHNAAHVHQVIGPMHDPLADTTTGQYAYEHNASVSPATSVVPAPAESAAEDSASTQSSHSSQSSPDEPAVAAQPLDGDIASASASASASISTPTSTSISTSTSTPTSSSVDAAWLDEEFERLASLEASLHKQREALQNEMQLFDAAQAVWKAQQQQRESELAQREALLADAELSAERLAQLADQLENERQQREAAEAILQQRDKATAALQNELAEARAAFKALEQSHRETLAQLEEAQALVTESSSQAKLAQLTIADHQLEINELLQRLQPLEQQFDQLMSESRQMEQQLRRQIEDQAARIEQLAAHESTLQQQMEAQEISRRAAVARANEAMHMLGSMREQIRMLHEHAKHVSSLQQQVAAVETAWVEADQRAAEAALSDPEQAAAYADRQQYYSAQLSELAEQRDKAVDALQRAAHELGDIASRHRALFTPVHTITSAAASNSPRRRWPLVAAIFMFVCVITLAAWAALRPEDLAFLGLQLSAPPSP